MLNNFFRKSIYGKTSTFGQGSMFFDNLTEITSVKERLVEFFFTEAVNTVV